MSVENALPAMLPARSIGIDGAPSTQARSPADVSPRSAASAPARIGSLVRQAMKFFETNREAAWCCLKDASTLLGAEEEESARGSPLLQNTLRTGGLAVWQAKRTVDYIEAHLGSKIAITEMARLLVLSKSHFSRAFKQSLGASPMAYVAERRVERAKLMMTSTRDRLTDIALACGFSDQSHLNRYFRRIVGVSPGIWRRSCQYETRAWRLP